MTVPETELMLDPLFDEGLDWVARMGSGDFTGTEREAFALWRARSPGHDAAFRRASALGHALRQASVELLDEERRRPNVVPFRRRTLDRRAILTGAVAASAAGLVLVAGGQGLMPSFGRRPDFSTGTGERRELAVAPGLAVNLDAQSSIAVSHVGGRHQITLISGRASINAQLQPTSGVDLVAGKGRAQAVEAVFDVEADHDRSCITCVSGMVTLAYADDRIRLLPRQQIAYTDEVLGQPVQVDAAAVTAWTTGQLVFRHTPLSEVIRQVNRYRPGKIVILGSALGQRPVSGVFHIANIDDAVGQIEQITGARVARLPAGVVVFS